jgi:hypothetical protein
LNFGLSLSLLWLRQKYGELDIHIKKEVKKKKKLVLVWIKQHWFLLGVEFLEK